jgi:hypothetical protein
MVPTVLKVQVLTVRKVQVLTVRKLQAVVKVPRVQPAS